jgi:TusA-related sulfurtransferase
MGREEKSNLGVLDLRGVPCPLSWAKAKIRLERLARGDRLTLWVNDPKGARDIPQAAESEGYAVEGATEQGGVWRITIQV